MKIGAFLKKKELGLPVWAWTLIASVLLFLLYRHYKNASGSSASGTDTSAQAPVSDVTVPTSGGGDGGGVGGAADDSAALTSLASGLQSLEQGQNDLLSAFQSGSSVGGIVNGSGDLLPGGAPGGNSSATTPTAGNGGGIQWGGQTFTTRAQFDAWLKARGLGWAAYAIEYPAAYAEYLKLPAGKTASAKAVASKTSVAPVTSTGKKAVIQPAKVTPPKSSVKKVPPKPVPKPKIGGGNKVA